ncbi:MAG: hypothetical protein IJH32_00510 [Ruminococcus sp.]|nr:hypothetical protein [Ruminococcus sp.]
MAYTYRNLAYDLRLFEETEEQSASQENGAKDKDGLTENKDAAVREKKQNKKVKSVKKSKKKKSGVVGIVVAAILGVAVLVTVVSIIHGQVQLTELNQQIINARDDLSEKQSLYTQLEMKVDSGISTSVVEQYAQDNLSMSKASNSQKEFINLSEGDKAEVSLDSHKNVFELIAEAISSLWS